MLLRSIDEIVAAYPWPPLSHAANLRELLGFIAQDSTVTDQRWVAYMLATARHESAFTYDPDIHEYGHGQGKPYGIRDPQTGETYYGRGWVQLTWRDNYQLFSDLLHVDFVHNPDLACEPEWCYKITSLGMVRGLFVSDHKRVPMSLGRFINDSKCEYTYARQIINGMDEAEDIAGYAQAFAAVLGCEWENRFGTR